MAETDPVVERSCGVCGRESIPASRVGGQVTLRPNLAEESETIDVCRFCWTSGGWSRYSPSGPHLDDTLRAASVVYHCIEDSLDRRFGSERAP